MRHALVLFAAVPLVVSACSVFGATANPLLAQKAVLGISNGTTLPVSLFVDGMLIETAMPGVGLKDIELDALPPLPWTAEARSPSGRVLTSMVVAVGSVTRTTDPSGNVGTSGTIGRVDLTCGRITIWAGYGPPSGPPPPSPAGSPGACAP